MSDSPLPLAAVFDLYIDFHHIDEAVDGGASAIDPNPQKKEVLDDHSQVVLYQHEAVSSTVVGAFVETVLPEQMKDGCSRRRNHPLGSEVGSLARYRNG